MIDLLQQRGHELRRPHTERLRKDICELRIHGEVGQIRLLYFLFDGAKIVITHGFVKKGNAVPPGEIDKAEAIRSAYYAASGKG
jgi:phage-related protein